MSDDLVHIQQRLASDGESTVAFFQSLSNSDWDQKVYTTGSEWRVRHFPAHFVSVERAYLRHMRDILSGGPGAPRDLDVDAFNEAETPVLSKIPLPELLTTFQHLRAESIALAKSLTESDKERVGYHPWFGEQKITWYFKLLYHHNALHIRDIRKTLETGQPVPHTEAHRVGRQVNPL